MRPRDELDLPRRFAAVLPPVATEFLVAIVVVVIALAARAAIDLISSGLVQFPLMFPAIVIATLLAGVRSGAVAVGFGQVLAWYFVLPFPFSFRFASAGNAVSLILTTAAELLLLCFLAHYRHVVRQATARAEAQADRLEGAVAGLTRQAQLDAQLRDQEQVLRETRQNLVVIYEASADGLTLCRAVKDRDGRIVDYHVIEVNRAHEELTGATRAQMMEAPVSQIAPPVDPRWFDSADRAVRTGVMQQFDVRSRVTGRWLNIRVSPVSADLFQQTFVDVSDRHRLEEQRAEILKEMSHRVMNNFQMIAGFLHLQSIGASAEVKTHLRTAESRVQVLAKLHSLLAYTDSDKEIDAAAYIVQLCDQLRAMIDRPRDIVLHCACDPLTMVTDRIVPLGFVISELVTNAAKYAFPAPASGTITVTLTAEQDQCRLVIHDNGRGMAAPPQDRPGRGLGTRLVQSFVSQIGGKLTTTQDPGLRHDITFTL